MTTLSSNRPVSVAARRATNANRRWLYGSLIPATLILAALSIWPVFNLVWLSLSSVTWSDGRPVSEFIGFANFNDLFRGEQVYWAGVRNTVVFAVCAVSAQMILGFSMALAVRRASGVGRGLLTAIFLLPIVIPPIVIGAMWRLMMGRDFGVINGMLAVIGLGPVDWLGDPRFALMSVIIVDVWHWTPFVFLLLLAGLEALDEEVLEAARLDVVNRWQELRHVIIPLMLPTILVTLAFRIILSFKVFDEVFLLTAGGPGTATEVINFSIYRVFFGQDRVGMGSAMSLLTLFVVAFLIIVAQVVVRRKRAGADQ
ncbi:carbohydrate ABC transporter permease [Pelagibacterium halotolerans]|uniref:ABC sugar transporter, inner membrane subunit n=1 Tax=Pelagibacterium halotolerans (strain DSM 22347 / JCM 15775 / CGMCC 1.7692 / B2) TaxID=1082931 RepID=G4R7A9_PELHB|nr:sugar ABC transporter permease [Pelagibacterium halotolerans]AEQ51245.1 ABC sugar transporter, inner membrane subunit [Pelagibacterium halotolerans B2]QJR18895.1 sugar ABC transporter permease [Pelagibacterium halotolerans]SEA67444.1 multiple sugar transport system permease protein [Pelagibacterium halotolerans]